MSVGKSKFKVTPFSRAFAAKLREGVKKPQEEDELSESALTLERLVEDAAFGALPISPAQRALVRAADGQPVIHLSSDLLHFHFGVIGKREYRNDKPKVVIVRSGVRSAKSLIGAFAALLKSSLHCKLRRPPSHPDERPGPDGLVGVRPGELVRALIVAPLLKLSRAPFHHLLGAMQASPRLKKLIVRDGTEFLELRRPDGVVVRVELVAASQGGANLRSTWLTGILFDEADFHDEEDAAVNLREQFDAVLPRILSGGQIWIVSSPWEDSGPFHELFTESFGQVGRILAFHSDSLSMNPTLDREDIEMARRRDPVMAAREYDAVPLPTGSTGFFPEAAIVACFTRPEPFNLKPNGAPHWAGTDLGFRKNSSVLALSRVVGPKTVIAYVEEQIPQKGAPLKPSEVCSSFGKTCVAYSATVVKGDIHYADTAKEELAKVSFERKARLWYDEFSPTSDAQAEVFTELRRRMVEGTLEGPADPRLIKQLKDTKMRKGPSGKIQVVLPKHGAAHGDVLMAVALSVVQVGARGPVEPSVVNKRLLPF